MNKYRLFFPTGKNTGTAYSISATAPLTTEEQKLLETYLKRSFQTTPLLSGSGTGLNGLKIIGPNLRHATPESAKRVEALHSGGLTKILQIEKFDMYLNDFGLEKTADRMLQSVYTEIPEILELSSTVSIDTVIPFVEQGCIALTNANKIHNIGLTEFDIQEVIIPMFKKYQRNPTLSELFTVAVVNSEHGRHHTMNAKGILSGETIPHTLFELIKEPFKINNGDTAVGFKDNSSALRAFANQILINPRIGNKEINLIYSAETHNYPTTIEAFHGAITGADGEERDIWGMGRGGQILFLVSGYAFGNLGLPNYQIPGEGKIYVPFPAKIEKPLDIAMKATKGVAMGGNETGYPTNVGYTRSFGSTDPNGQAWSFWKTQLFAGAAGYVCKEHLKKHEVTPGMKVYMIGGPAYLIGKGGSQNSSQMQGVNDADMDWNGVQRGNPFMSRKVAEVMSRCIELGTENPIVSVHDQGAGGIGNVLTELVAPHGALLDIAKVTLGDHNLSHSDIWTAEYQERMAMVISPENAKLFEEICLSEKLNCECLGEITETGRVVVIDSRINETIINLQLTDILGSVPQMIIHDIADGYKHTFSETVTLPKGLQLKEALCAVLKRTEVGSKDWHLRYKDHTVLGKTVVHQYAGPGQIPINDYALSLISQHSLEGGLVSIGEQPIMITLNPRAGVRMSMLEALLNSAGVVKKRSALQANEMISAKISGEYARAVEMLEAAKDMAIQTGKHFDGGKDSTNMTVVSGKDTVISPPTFVVTQYATVEDVRKHVPAYFVHPGKSRIIAINASGSKNKFRLGGSPLTTAYDIPWNGTTPDVDDVTQVNKVLAAVAELVTLGYVTACHDTVGDGILVSVLEMALAGGCGANIVLDTNGVIADTGVNPLFAKAFAQEGWIIIEVPAHYYSNKENHITEILRKHGVDCYEPLGWTAKETFICREKNGVGASFDFAMSYTEMWNAYNSTSMELKKERISRAGGNINLVAQEREFWKQPKATKQRVYADFGKLSFARKQNSQNPGKVKALVLRAEGSNGQNELGFMFESAGFEVSYANMEQMLQGVYKLKDFQLLLLPGGFSFGDLFGSGVAWAMQFKNSFLMKDLLEFIARLDTLIFGVCNGYQALNELNIMFPEITIQDTPRLVSNESRLFEHHLNYVTIPKAGNVVMLQNMEGWILPIYSAHGEGNHYFKNTDVRTALTSQGRAPLRFANANGKPTGAYPCNPNGSFHGIAGMASANGRILGMMPHPERLLFANNLPYVPFQWEGKLDKYTPWIMVAYNARAWCLINQSR